VALLIKAAPDLLSGLLVTLLIGAGAAVLATAAAFVAGLASHARSRAVRVPARIYIEVFRGTSALVQLYFLFYVLPLLGVLLPAWAVGILGLGLCIGAYGAVVVTAAVGAVPPGQKEAAAALGLRPMQAMRLVVLPQALRVMLPQFGNLSVELLKATALVSLITLHDLTFEAQMFNQETLHTAEAFLTILVVYYLLAQGIMRGFGVLQARFDVGARGGHVL
jgi:polar amino acid transport system permease protein